jgi:hypothetical protein
MITEELVVGELVIARCSVSYVGGNIPNQILAI